MPVLDLTYKHLFKIMPALNSRARHGAFKTLELRWTGEAWDDLYNAAMYWLEDIYGPQYQMWEILLDALGHARKSRKFEGRVVIVPVEGGDEGKMPNTVQFISRELNEKFGGELFMGDVLCWKENVQVDEGYLGLFLATKHRIG